MVLALKQQPNCDICVRLKARLTMNPRDFESTHAVLENLNKGFVNNIFTHLRSITT